MGLNVENPPDPNVKGSKGAKGSESGRMRGIRISWVSRNLNVPWQQNNATSVDGPIEDATTLVGPACIASD